MPKGKCPACGREKVELVAKGLCSLDYQRQHKNKLRLVGGQWVYCKLEDVPEPADLAAVLVLGPDLQPTRGDKAAAAWEQWRAERKQVESGGKAAKLESGQDGGDGPEGDAAYALDEQGTARPTLKKTAPEDALCTAEELEAMGEALDAVAAVDGAGALGSEAAEELLDEAPVRKMWEPVESGKADEAVGAPARGVGDDPFAALEMAAFEPLASRQLSYPALTVTGHGELALNAEASRRLGATRRVRLLFARAGERVAVGLRPAGDEESGTYSLTRANARRSELRVSARGPLERLGVRPQASVRLDWSPAQGAWCAMLETMQPA